MTTREKDPVLIVLQLTGGNDYMNTVIPYPESTEGGRRVSVLKRQEGAPVNLG